MTSNSLRTSIRHSTGLGDQGYPNPNSTLVWANLPDLTLKDGIDIPRWSILRCRGGGDMLPGEDPGRANEPIDMDEEVGCVLVGGWV
eukprot:803683-Amorphochlora_amoeboformis.AAC.2